MNWNKNVGILLEISKNAGNAILDIYHSEAHYVELKNDNSPLTIADKNANKVICEALKTNFPDVPIISEENLNVPYSVRKEFEYFWLVDPLDGTKEFVKRNGEFTVNIALVKNREVIGGVIYLPVTEELFYAHKGDGAFRINSDGKTKLTANRYKDQDEDLKVVCSRSHLNPETQTFIEKLNKPQLVSRGSSLKFMMLASGQAEIYPRLAPTMEWDTAAAQIILEEAGGQVINCETGQKLTYNKAVLRNPHFIAYAQRE